MFVILSIRHMRNLKKSWPNRFNRFDVFLDTNGQTDKQTPSEAKYIDRLYVSIRPPAVYCIKWSVKPRIIHLT